MKSNVVPSKAEAEVEGLEENILSDAIEKVGKETGVAFSCEEREGCFHIFADGVSAHASTPEEGKNGIVALLFTPQRIASEGRCSGKMRSLYQLFPYGDVNGKAAGIYLSDEESVRLP